MRKNVIKLYPLRPKEPVVNDYTEIFGDYVVHYSTISPCAGLYAWSVLFQCRDMAHIDPQYHWQYIDPIWWKGPQTDDGGYRTLTEAREDVRRQLFRWRNARQEEKQRAELDAAKGE